MQQFSTRRLVISVAVPGSDDITAWQVAETTYAGLVRAPFICGIEPVRSGEEIPEGAKVGEAITAAAVILEILPAAVEQLFEWVRERFAQPGAPTVEMVVKEEGREYSLKFWVTSRVVV